MSYEIWANGNNTWDVKQNGAPVHGAHVIRIEFEEGFADGPSGRTYSIIPGSGRGTIRLPNGAEISKVPLKP